MLNVNIDDARHFLESNMSFFTTPLDDQQAFRKHFEKDGTLDDIEQYSSQLIKVLHQTMHQTRKYNAPVWLLWKDKNFELALMHREVRDFIINNAAHPAILSWQSAHPALDIEKKKTLLNNNEKKFMAASIQTMHGILTQAINALNIQKNASAHSSAFIQTAIIILKKQLLLLQLIKMDLKESNVEYKITDIKKNLEKIQGNLMTVINTSLLNESQPDQIKELAKELKPVIVNTFKIHCDEKGNIKTSNLPQHSMFSTNKPSAEVKLSEMFEPPKEPEIPDITP